MLLGLCADKLAWPAPRAGKKMPRFALSRPDFGVLALLFAIGMVVAALAVAVLVTYHNGPTVLRLLGADRLQYDNAWVVLCVGLSLIMYALRMHALVRLCAVAAMLISGLPLPAFIFPSAITPHPYLANPG